MARVFITGSADGLGRELARQLQDDGHEVVVHGRTERRASDAREAVPGALASLVGDLSRVASVRELAAAAGEYAPFDAVVHNAGVGFRERREVTEDGVEHVFAVNVLAPYVLTALLPAERLIYLTSGLHRRGDPDLRDLAWERRPWNAMQAYADSKLLDVALALAVDRIWPDVCSTAVEPGWIATKMGGAGAPGTLAEGVDTQLWLITAEDVMCGRLYHRREVVQPARSAQDSSLQDELIAACAEVSGVELPAHIDAR